MSFHVNENYRLRDSLLTSCSRDGNNGGFLLHYRSVELWCIASDGEGWEHVSVHAHDAGRRDRIPTWEEMCYVKRTFWDAEDVVMQLHPRESRYVNDHPCVLHLWRPVGQTIPEPPTHMVGRVAAREEER